MKVAITLAVLAAALAVGSGAYAQTVTPKPSASAAPAQPAVSVGALADVARRRTLPPSLSEAERTKASAIVALLKKGADADATAKLRELTNDLASRGVSAAARRDVGWYVLRRGILDPAPALLQTVDRYRFAEDKQSELQAQAKRLTAAIAKLATGGTAQVQIVAVRPTFSVDADPVSTRGDEKLDKKTAQDRLNETQMAMDQATLAIENAKTLHEAEKERFKEALRRIVEHQQRQEAMNKAAQI